MGPEDIKAIRKRLNLSQIQLASILGVHWVTVSKWERGAIAPDAYRQALLSRFDSASQKPESGSNLVNVLMGAGVAAALFMLLKSAFESEKPSRARSPRKTGARRKKRS